MNRVLVLAIAICLIACSGDDESPPPVLAESFICYEEHLTPNVSQLVTIKPDGTGKEILLKETSPLFHNVNIDPKWSFDGKKIVFVSLESSIAPLGDIYIVDRDGSNLKNLTNSLRARSMPSLSPDETTLVFSDYDNLGNIQIFSKVVSQAEEKQLTFFTSDSRQIHCYFPTWSSDGKKIVFTANKEEPTSNVYSMNADGSNVKKITTNTNRAAFGPRLSPDGSTIIYYTYKDDSSEGNIFSINMDGSGKKQLTNISPNEDTKISTDPSWSPDGTQILFVAHKYDPDNDALFIMKALMYRK